MKRLIGLFAVLALCLPMVGEGQSIEHKSSGVATSSTGGSFFAGGVSLGNTSASPYANLFGGAANTLALRNGTNAQTFNIYNTYTDASNYERASLAYNTNVLVLDSQAAGTGTVRNLSIRSGGVEKIKYSVSGDFLEFVAGDIGSRTFRPSSADNYDLGLTASSLFWRNLYLSRSTQGSKTKALTEASATAVTQIAVPQTAGSNFADATIEWAVYASDGTDSQVRKGSTYLAAVNKAGTETCTVGDVGTTQVAVSAGTLTCTTSCITGLTDVVQFALDCTSSLTQTSLNALTRLNMMQPNTVTPQ